MRLFTPQLLLVCLGAVVGCSGTDSTNLEANKELIRQFTAASNAADWDALVDIVADDFSRHSAASPGAPVTSRDEFVQLQESFLVSFPDQLVTVERLVADGDFVAALATYTATHTGPMGQVPATGNAVSVPFLALFRIEDGKIVELWAEWDNMFMLTQLGLAPPPPSGD